MSKGDGELAWAVQGCAGVSGGSRQGRTGALEAMPVHRLVEPT